MYSFATEQRTVEIGHLKVGGQPGELPTVMFGTIFYGRKPKPIDRARAEEQVSEQRRMSELTGNPCVLDVFIPTAELAEERLSTALELVPGDHAIAIDVPEAEARIAALRHLSDVGALQRTIYNSLNLGVTEEEIAALAEHPPGAAILLGYNPRDMSTDGRLQILESGSGILDRGLLDIAGGCGIGGILLDTGATPFDHSAAETLRAIPAMKNKWGHPTGCSIHNLVESWLWLKGYKKDDPGIYDICDIGSNGLPILLGADYTLYGPIKNASRAFPFVAMVDKLVSEGAEEYFGVEPSEAHPRRRLE